MRRGSAHGGRLSAVFVSTGPRPPTGWPYP